MFAQVGLKAVFAASLMMMGSACVPFHAPTTKFRISELSFRTSPSVREDKRFEADLIAEFGEGSEDLRGGDAILRVWLCEDKSLGSMPMRLRTSGGDFPQSDNFDESGAKSVRLQAGPANYWLVALPPSGQSGAGRRTDIRPGQMLCGRLEGYAASGLAVYSNISEAPAP